MARSQAAVTYQLPLREAWEFVTKKDYVDNWRSEMHERFCFWGFSQWQEVMKEAGFSVDPASEATLNPWIEENRIEGAVVLRDLQGEELPLPPTGMVLVGKKMASTR